MTYITLIFDAPLLLICDPLQKMNRDYIENTAVIHGVILRGMYLIFISPSLIVKRLISFEM